MWISRPRTTPANGNCSLLLLNRDLDNEREVEITFRDMTPTKVLASETLTGKDLKAANSFAKPTNISPATLDAPSAGSKMTLKLPARSYSVLQVATS